MRTARPSFVKAMELAKAAALRPARSTISRSRRRKPTPPNELWPPSANHSGSSFMEVARHRQLSKERMPSTVPQPSDPARVGFHPDDTTPIPRPSRYYGRRQYAPLTEQLRSSRAGDEQNASLQLRPLFRLNPIFGGQIDKSQLTIAEPKRLRDKAHLKFVASQPCLVCGRQPTDPHHSAVCSTACYWA